MKLSRENKGKNKSSAIKPLNTEFSPNSFAEFVAQQEDASANLYRLDIVSGNPYTDENEKARNKAYINSLKAFAEKAEAKLKRPGRPPEYNDDDVSAVREFVLHSKAQKNISPFYCFVKWYKKNRNGSLPFRTTTFYKIKNVIKKR